MNLCSLRRKSFAPRPGGSRGFTLIELMIVISIILILIGIAASSYQRAVLRSKEAVLKEDLQEMRKAIDHFTMDKQAAPQTLEDLVPQYLHSVPTDPITNGKDWNTVVDSVVLTPDQASSGITDVHSASDKVSPIENTPYNTW
ncbi:MAG TPA: prepilin-type N-terminal cleavage/methylation domain-containing protein [Dongiaceae bacterium]|nr:prepilin-type N-terminal cleavage/methylation domain-containing protein [Dongiaceae bacterium]